MNEYFLTEEPAALKFIPSADLSKPDLDRINEHLNYLLRDTKEHAHVAEIATGPLVTFIHGEMRLDEHSDDRSNKNGISFRFHISTARLKGGGWHEDDTAKVDNDNAFLIANHTYLCLTANNAFT